MLVEVTVKHLPNVGPRGTRKTMPAQAANALILLGKVKEVTEVVPIGEPAPKTYKRRDMVAESATEPKKKKRGRPRKVRE